MRHSATPVAPKRLRVTNGTLFVTNRNKALFVNGAEASVSGYVATSVGVCGPGAAPFTHLRTKAPDGDDENPVISSVAKLGSCYDELQVRQAKRALPLFLIRRAYKTLNFTEVFCAILDLALAELELDEGVSPIL